MTSISRTEQRSVIKFCVHANMTPTETWKFISKADTTGKCSRQLVFKWHSRFRSGDENVLDKKRSGRPKVAEPNYVERIRTVLDEDRRRTLREISDILCLKRTVVHKKMTKRT
jgi:transposase